MKLAAAILALALAGCTNHTAAYVSDDENPIYGTLKYVSVAGIVLGGFALVYTIKNWKLV